VFTDVTAQLLELCNRETAVLGEQNGARVTDSLRNLGDGCFLVRHGAPCVLVMNPNTSGKEKLRRMALGVKTAIAAITFCTCAGLHLGETSTGELLRR
jgi:hypothetical protein